MTDEEPDDALLRVRGLGRRFGDAAVLTGLDLRVAAGEVVALLGANGSGKTTALRCMAGELVPSSGTVRVAGADPQVEPEAERARRRLAFVADTPVFYRELTVGEHLRLVAAAFDDATGAKRGRAVLEELGLGARLRSRPHELSSGQRQKVLLACISARPFDLLLLDEPVLRLDPASQRWLHQLLLSHARNGVGIVLTTHQPRFAEGLADRAVCLAEGVVVSDEPFETFLARGGADAIGEPADSNLEDLR